MDLPFRPIGAAHAGNASLMHNAGLQPKSIPLPTVASQLKKNQ